MMVGSLRDLGLGKASSVDALNVLQFCSPGLCDFSVFRDSMADLFEANLQAQQDKSLLRVSVGVLASCPVFVLQEPVMTFFLGCSNFCRPVIRIPQVALIRPWLSVRRGTCPNFRTIV